MWNNRLTPKSCKYYAIAKYAGPEKTWTAYFKAMKSLESLADAVNKEREQRLGYRKLLEIGNDAAMSFSREAITRICAALTNREKLSEMKTLLEWLGLLYNEAIPEVDFLKIPYSTSLADWLMERKD